MEKSGIFKEDLPFLQDLKRDFKRHPSEGDAFDLDEEMDKYDASP
jgi:hypothetical protein